MTDAFADDAAEIAELEKQQEAAGQGPGGKGAVQDQPAPETQQPAQEQAQPEAKDDDEEIEVENRGRFIRWSLLAYLLCVRIVAYKELVIIFSMLVFGAHST